VSLNFGSGDENARLDPRDRMREWSGGSDYAPAVWAERDRRREQAELARLVWVDQTGAAATPAVEGRREAGQGRQTGGTGADAIVGLWATGSVDWGRMDAQGRRDDRFTTQGLTVGVDGKLTDRLIVGGGVGYAYDRTRIGDEGSISEGRGITGALYASYRPIDGYYVDGLVGHGQLDFDSRRWAEGLASQADAFAYGERSGDLTFGSLAFGRTSTAGPARRTFYVRFDARQIELDGFTETGAGLSNLSWNALRQDSLSAALGGAWSWSHDLRERGVITPSIRMEWAHELEGATNQGVRYADWTASPVYLVPVDGWARDQLRLDGGLEWRVGETLIGVGYRGSFSDTSVSHGAEFKLKWRWPEMR
jgi:outer membrane autotransporter protein